MEQCAITQNIVLALDNNIGLVMYYLVVTLLID